MCRAGRGCPEHQSYALLLSLLLSPFRWGPSPLRTGPNRSPDGMRGPTPHPSTASEKPLLLAKVRRRPAASRFVGYREAFGACRQARRLVEVAFPCVAVAV